MPKSIQEFDTMQEIEGRAGGKKVDWTTIADQIVKSGQAYTVKEVWENLAAKKVTQFRCKNALDKLAEDGKLRRLWDGKRFYYGPMTMEVAAVAQ